MTRSQHIWNMQAVLPSFMALEEVNFSDFAQQFPVAQVAAGQDEWLIRSMVDQPRQIGLFAGLVR